MVLQHPLSYMEGSTDKQRITAYCAMRGNRRLRHTSHFGRWHALPTGTRWMRADRHVRDKCPSEQKVALVLYKRRVQPPAKRVSEGRWALAGVNIRVIENGILATGSVGGGMTCTPRRCSSMWFSLILRDGSAVGITGECRFKAKNRRMIRHESSLCITQLPPKHF